MLCAPASADVVGGVIRDRADAGKGVTAAQDIRKVTARYDSAGTYSGSITLGKAPGAGALSFVEVGFGTWRPKSADCAIGESGDAVQVFAPTAARPQWFSGLFIGGEEGPAGTASLAGKTVSFSVTAPGGANRGINCGGAVTTGPRKDSSGEPVSDDSVPLFSLTSEEAAGKPAPNCSIRSSKVRRGAPVRLKCAHVGRRATTVRIYKDPRFDLRKTVTAKIRRRGRVSVSSRGLRRGVHTVVAWRGKTMIGWGEIKVR